jgi:16S rRNA processing protein RimM
VVSERRDDRTARDERIVLATLGRAHGIRGAIRARVFNVETTLLEPGCVVRISPPDGPKDAEDDASGGPDYVECSIVKRTRAGDGWVLELAGVEDRSAAEELTGALVWVPRSELPALEEGEFYLADVEGYSVVDGSGTLVGRVTKVETYPTVNVLVIAREAGGSIEVPIVDGLVVSVDNDGRRFVIDAEALSES